MESLILKRIAGLITANAGLRMREGDYSHLADTLWKRVKSCGLRSLEEYYGLLIKELEAHHDLSLGQVSTRLVLSPQLEWHNLFTQLTINESYFFRDRSQFNLITQTILPDLIDRKQRHHERYGNRGLPCLRIWSAGCSTGEELYSIAIALNEIHFPWQAWDTLLIGTDISVAALSVAQEGIYGNWSFRQTDPSIQAKYFRYQRQSLQVREDIRRRVTFQYGNLVKDNFPSPATALSEIDLILCRNVFIYFDTTAIARTLEKFSRTLAPNGYLITGHTELYSQDTSQFQLKIFPESLVYQHRTWTAAAEQSQPMSPRVKPRPIESTPALPTLLSANQWSSDRNAPAPAVEITQESAIAIGLSKARENLEKKAYAEAIRHSQHVCTQDTGNFEAYKILAKAHANIGAHQPAKDFCKRALSLQPLNLELHYLLAQIAEEEGDIDLAKEHLRRIIYIDAYEFRAYLDLASLYQRESRLDQVQKMERLALKTLNLLPATVVVDPETGATVSDWRQHLEKKLAV